MTDEDNIQYNTPTVHDVLCGRGGGTNIHEGNKRFRAVVAEHQQDYLAAKKKEKVAISRQIVKIIENNGGRFLQKNGTTGLWEPIVDKKAIEKTSQALREWNLTERSKAIKRALENSESATDNN